MTFDVHKLVRPSHFWTTNANFDSCCQHYIATCIKKLYRCTSMFQSLKVLRWNFFEISHLSIWSCAHKLFCRFLDFS